MWAPWRMEYVEGDKKLNGQCVLCHLADLPPEEHAAWFVLERGEHAFVVLNRFPYAGGHLMVVPHAHGAEWSGVSALAAQEIHTLMVRWEAVLRRGLGAQGCNVGLNLGRVAGAGIPDHLHYHVVPRWANDTNFMPVLGDCRVIPQALEATYARLKAVQAEVDDA